MMFLSTGLWWWLKTQNIVKVNYCTNLLVTEFDETKFSPQDF